MSAVPKLPIKRQRFAELLPICKSGKEAAEKAGYAPGQSAEVEASRLLRNAKVMEAIEAKQAEIQAKNELTEESIIRELDEIKQGAAKDRNWSAAKGAVDSKAKIAGLFKEDQPVKPGNELIDDAISNPEFLDSFVSRWKERLAAGESLPTLGI